MTRKLSDILNNEQQNKTINKIIRENYKPLNDLHVPSTKNEPSTGIIEIMDSRFYPDMYETYRVFANRYNLDHENFILTNGCENALRIALLAIKPKSMLIENPTWGMVEPICAGLEIPYQKVDYHFIQNKTFRMDNINHDKKAWLYTTETYNNFFKHEKYDTEFYNNVIIDETYTLSELLRNIEPEDRIFRKNEIIIGSFSKFGGCGLRLGYILFNKYWNEKMQLLREQYISPLASKYIINYNGPDKTAIRNMITKKCEYPIVSEHLCYTTIAVDNEISVLNYKEFIVDNQRFIRIGV
jgi:histidinol-phosphate/aromatic aminotransferase/cobyric acid decarboxylase-like protein